MADSEGGTSRRRVRRWRSVAEKRHIVQLTLEPGASVAEVARSHGLNANQVFKWLREFERGEQMKSYPALLPVTMAAAIEPESGVTEQRRETLPSSSGAIHIELTG